MKTHFLHPVGYVCPLQFFHNESHFNIPVKCNTSCSEPLRTFGLGIGRAAIDISWNLSTNVFTALAIRLSEAQSIYHKMRYGKVSKFFKYLFNRICIFVSICSFSLRDNRVLLDFQVLPEKD